MSQGNPPPRPEKGTDSGFLTGEKVPDEDRQGIIGETNDEDTAYDHDRVDEGEGEQRSGA